MKDLEILREVENPLLDRKEVNFRVIHEGEATPKRDEVRELLAAALKTNKKNVVVERMDHEFGKAETVGTANIYKSVEAAKKAELPHILKRNGLVEEKKEESQEQ